jgi:hypothetical protein
MRPCYLRPPARFGYLTESGHFVRIVVRLLERLGFSRGLRAFGAEQVLDPDNYTVEVGVHLARMDISWSYSRPDDLFLRQET